MGIAISNGQGVAMTNTARKRIASPEKYQAANAINNAMLILLVYDIMNKINDKDEI